MADIRQYRRIHDEHFSDTEGEENHEELINKHRKKMIVIALIAAVVIALVFLLFKLISDNANYTDYSVVNSINRNDNSAATYIPYDSGYIRYSFDGITSCDMNGNSRWNHSYTRKNPSIDINDDMVAIGDINGTNILVFDSKGLRGSIDTAIPIVQVVATSKDLVIAVLDGDTANFITMYDTAGNKVYSIKTSLTGDGYPIDVSCSPDGTKLIASFLYVSGESVRSNVVFYNFSDVGQNETERLVGGFNHYENTIVPEVHFIDEKNAIAVGENVITFFSMGEYPKLVKEVKYDTNIDKVFYDDSYVGIISDSKSEGNRYNIKVFTLSGNEKFSTDYTQDYTDAQFVDGGVMLNNGSTMALIGMNGKLQMEKRADTAIEKIIPTKTKNRFALVSAKYIQEIVLR